MFFLKLGDTTDYISFNTDRSALEYVTIEHAKRYTTNCSNCPLFPVKLLKKNQDLSETEWSSMYRTLEAVLSSLNGN